MSAYENMKTKFIYLLSLFTLQVLIPTILYIKHWFIKAVPSAIPAIKRKIIPKVPVIIFVKYKVIKTAAITILIIISNFPTFRFMISIFKFIN